MNGNCVTCRWFARSPYPEDAPDDDDPGKWGRCTFVVDHMENPREPHSVRAYPADASSYSAWLVVREDFGCVEHTAGSGSGDTPQ